MEIIDKLTRIMISTAILRNFILHILVLLFVSGLLFPLYAQPSIQNDFNKFVKQHQQEFKKSAEKQKQDFAKFKSEARQQYEAFRDKTNAEFADFMQRQWTAVKVQPAIPAPIRPEPPTPVIKDPEDNSPVPIERLPIANINPLAPMLPHPSPAFPS